MVFDNPSGAACAGMSRLLHVSVVVLALAGWALRSHPLTLRGRHKVRVAELLRRS